MIVYWYLAPNPPGEEKLSDVSTQQLRIKNSSLLDTGSCDMNARSRSRMLGVLMFLVPGMNIVFSVILSGAYLRAFDDMGFERAQTYL